MERNGRQSIQTLSARSTLWLVRHGQTDWNLTGRWQGQSPEAPALNETGRAQALDVQEQLRGARIAAVYSSDLLRSRQTAELLAAPLGLSVSLDPRLREMDLGDWEGMLSDEIQIRYPQQMAERRRDPVNARAPGGESPRQVASRVLPAVDEITMRHCGEPVLVVAHGISLAVIRCLAAGIPLDRLYEHLPGNARLHRVMWQASGYGRELTQEKGLWYKISLDRILPARGEA